MSREKHLLVDGSNVVKAWPELKNLDRTNRDLARARLCAALQVLHDFEFFRVTLVFDGKGTDSVIEYPCEQDTFAQIFTPSHLTADDVIEHLVGQAAQAASCWVATDDRAERQTVEALGAASFSCAELAERIAQANLRQQAKVAGRKKENDDEWRRNK